jgi:RNA polymerase sigma-70 factor (ECF subfamily)
VPDIEDDRDQRERRFRSLYEEHYRSIQVYALRRAEPADDVADVVAEVFTIAWRRLARIPGPPPDRLWLYGVARRVVAGKLRSARRCRQLTARLQASHAADRNPGAHDQEPAQGLGQVLVHGGERS